MPDNPETPDKPTPEEIKAMESHARIIAGIDNPRPVVVGTHWLTNEQRRAENERVSKLTPEEYQAEQEEAARAMAPLLEAHKKRMQRPGARKIPDKWSMDQ